MPRREGDVVERHVGGVVQQHAKVAADRLDRLALEDALLAEAAAHAGGLKALSMQDMLKALSPEQRRLREKREDHGEVGMEGGGTGRRRESASPRETEKLATQNNKTGKSGSPAIVK